MHTLARLLAIVAGMAVPASALAQSMGEGDPKKCWLCDGVMQAMGVADAAMASAGGTLVSGIMPLMATLVGISLMYGAGTAVVQGASPLRHVQDVLMRLLVVGALAGATAGVGSTVAEWVVGPAVTAGAGLGAELSDAAASAVGVNLNSECTRASDAESRMTALKDASEALFKLTCKVHQAGSVGIRLGAVVLSKQTKIWPVFEVLKSCVFFICGIVFMVMSVLTMVAFAFALIEAIVKAAVVGALSPLLMFAWIFPSTRGTIKNVASMLLFTFVLLAMSGLAAVVMAYILMMSFGLGLGIGINSTPDQIKSSFESIANSWESVGSMGPFMKFVAFSLTGFLFASRLMKAAQSVAAEVCQFAQGQAGEIASAGQGAFTGFFKRGIAAAGVAGGVGAKVGGAVAGKGLGAVLGSGAKGVAKGGIAKGVMGAAGAHVPGRI